jgi:hypothetical protein
MLPLGFFEVLNGKCLRCTTEDNVEVRYRVCENLVREWDVFERKIA